jgi:hypothetical protein
VIKISVFKGNGRRLIRRIGENGTIEFIQKLFLIGFKRIEERECTVKVH